MGKSLRSQGQSELTVLTLSEPPNVNVLRDLVAAIAPVDGHESLRAALASHYPALEWRVAEFKESWSRPGNRVYDSVGNLIAENRRAWINELLDAANGDYHRVWAENSGKGYATITEEGHSVFAGAAIGSRPEDVIEIKMDWFVDAIAEEVFQSQRPMDANDLLGPAGYWQQANWKPQISPRYNLRWMNVIDRTLEMAEQIEYSRRQEYVRTHSIWESKSGVGRAGRGNEPQKKSLLELDPNFLRHRLGERRFIADWAESTAGATPILTHWAFDVSDYEFEGERHLSITPRPITWADEIEWRNDRSLYQLMDLLERFDAAIGHSMAWFFHATYGNRLGIWAIRAVARGLERRKIGLADRDVKVIRRWVDDEYGF